MFKSLIKYLSNEYYQQLRLFFHKFYTKHPIHGSAHLESLPSKHNQYNIKFEVLYKKETESFVVALHVYVNTHAIFSSKFNDI